MTRRDNIEDAKIAAQVDADATHQPIDIIELEGQVYTCFQYQTDEIAETPDDCKYVDTIFPN